MLRLNPNLQLIITDVDETVADIYIDAHPHLIECLTHFITKGVKLMLCSCGGLQSIEQRIVMKFAPALRRHILVSHCCSSEVWGYEVTGERRASPFFSSAAGVLSEKQQVEWRNIMRQMIEVFQLKTLPAMPIKQFIEKTQGDPLAVIYDDRGVQITLEVVNAYNLTPTLAQQLHVPATDGMYDLRTPLIQWARTAFQKAQLPIYAHNGGVFALNFLISQSDKGDSVKLLQKDAAIQQYLEIDADIFQDPSAIEVWGDKFSQKSGSNDWCISLALDPRVRSISFRKDDEAEHFPKGCNIVKWDGKQDLFAGVLEYVQQG